FHSTSAIFAPFFASGSVITTAAAHIAAWDLGFRILYLTEWSGRRATNCPMIIESSRRGCWAASTTNIVSRRPRERRYEVFAEHRTGVSRRSVIREPA